MTDQKTTPVRLFSEKDSEKEWHKRMKNSCCDSFYRRNKVDPVKSGWREIQGYSCLNEGSSGWCVWMIPVLPEEVTATRSHWNRDTTALSLTYETSRMAVKAVKLVNWRSPLSLSLFNRNQTEENDLVVIVIVIIISCNWEVKELVCWMNKMQLKKIPNLNWILFIRRNKKMAGESRGKRVI